MLHCIVHVKRNVPKASRSLLLEKFISSRCYSRKSRHLSMIFFCKGTAYLFFVCMSNVILFTSPWATFCLLKGIFVRQCSVLKFSTTMFCSQDLVGLSDSAKLPLCWILYLSAAGSLVLFLTLTKMTNVKRPAEAREPYLYAVYFCLQTFQKVLNLAVVCWCDFRWQRWECCGLNLSGNIWAPHAGTWADGWRLLHWTGLP